MTQASEWGEEISGADRRESPRHAFGIVQQVAEMIGGEMPASDSFKRVQIVDVSRRGFAYYTLSEPTRDEVVVIMGDPPALECMTARIVYAQTLEEFGHQIFRIGCHFTGNAELDVHGVLGHQSCGTVTMIRDLSGLSDVSGPPSVTEG